MSVPRNGWIDPPITLIFDRPGRRKTGHNVEYVPNLRHHRVMIIYPIRCALWLTLLLLFPIAVIRARPWDDGLLRAFLAPPDDCPVPCFMGIRPGVTTAEAATGILKNHAWVDRLRVAPDHSIISIEWDQSAPDGIDRTTPAQLYIADGIVRVVDIKTTYPVWTFYLLAGQPEQTDSGASKVGVAVAAYYFDRSMMIYALLSCPVTRAKFWDSEMYVSFGDFRGATGFSNINFAC